MIAEVCLALQGCDESFAEVFMDVPLSQPLVPEFRTRNCNSVSTPACNIPDAAFSVYNRLHLAGCPFHLLCFALASSGTAFRAALPLHRALVASDQSTSLVCHGAANLPSPLSCPRRDTTSSYCALSRCLSCCSLTSCAWAESARACSSASHAARPCSLHSNGHWLQGKSNQHLQLSLPCRKALLSAQPQPPIVTGARGRM